MAPPGNTRTALEVAAVLVAVLAGAWLLFRKTVYEPVPVAPVAAAAPAPAAHRDELIVMAVNGDVVHISPGGATSGLSVGERLGAKDALRTGRGGRTDLQVGDKGRLAVGESSLLTVRELTEKVHRFSLSRGRVGVDYQPDGARVLRIESDAGDAVAETRGARFSMLSTGTSVAIASEAGTVGLTSRDSTVQVPAGQQAVATAGNPPSAAEPIPAKLLLKVADAAAAAHAQGLCADLDGRAPRGAEVLVDGLPAPVAQDGRFRLRVPQAPDRGSVLVTARDASGRETSRAVPCAGATASARIKDFAIRWHKRAAPP